MLVCHDVSVEIDFCKTTFDALELTTNGACTVANAPLECQFYPPSNLNTVATFIVVI